MRMSRAATASPSASALSAGSSATQEAAPCPAPRGLAFPPDRAIHNRSDVVNDHTACEDLEGDLMIYRKVHGPADVARLCQRR